MATRPSPDETAKTIIDALVTDLRLLPGQAVPFQTLKACLLARGVHVQDLAAGLDYAGNTRDWIEDGPSKGSVRVTASGFAEASQPTAPAAPSTAKPPGSQKRRLWKLLVGAAAIVVATLISVSTILGGVIPTLEYFHIEWSAPAKATPGSTAPQPAPSISTSGDCSPVVTGQGASSNPDCSKHYEGASQRHLSKAQSGALIAVARETCNEMINVTAANSNNEAQIYAIDFVNGFKAAGCQAKLALPIPGLRPEITGVSIGVRPTATNLADLRANNPGGYFLYTAITAVGIKFTVANVEPSFFPDSKFVLVIGGQESPNVLR
jgi:hypothetical protein